MIFNNIKYERLSYLLDYLDDPLNGIPKNEGGIYYWVYWPDFNPSKISSERLRDKLIEFTNKTLFSSEKIKGKYKFEGYIYEQWYPLNGNAFGLSVSKSRKLFNFLADENNRSFFSQFFKEMCFSKPFYVGKANNLRVRLKQHFNRNTEILPEIEEKRISFREIWVGYKIVEKQTEDDINNILEEVLSRSVKPGLTKKPN